MTPPRGRGQFISGGLTLGQRLHAARDDRGWTIEEVSGQTGVPVTGIIALEDGAYERLSAAVYGRNFVRAYARLLELSGREFEDLFERESRAFFSRQHMLPTFVRKDRKSRWFLRFHPKLIRIGATASIALVLASYLGFRLHAMLAQPGLVLLSPSQDVVLDHAIT
ncbi:MAG: helix-turn-helix domain-containing protein, partial [bacterium]|nr:helix-turn-helix domain-containing protein [bacterium]